MFPCILIRRPAIQRYLHVVIQLTLAVVRAGRQDQSVLDPLGVYPVYICCWAHYIKITIIIKVILFIVSCLGVAGNLERVSGELLLCQDVSGDCYKLL